MKPRHEHGMNPGSPAWQFRELNQAHRMATDYAFSKFGVRDLGQPILLFILEDSGTGENAPTQRDLAVKLNISPTTVTISLKSLERMGYVRRITDDTDMRRKRIEITRKGLEAAKLCREAFRTIDTVMYNGFTQQEQDLLSVFHRRMTENLYDYIKLPKNPCERKDADGQDNH